MNSRLDVAAAVEALAPRNPHFARIGGELPVARIVDAFYRNMDELSQAAAIRALHPVDLRASKEILFKYLVGWLGGPPLYVAERGNPRLRQKHSTFPIGDAERDAWMLCMRLALEEHVEEAQLRGELLQAFAKIASVLRNR